MADRYGCRQYGNAEALLADPEVAAVAVCTVNKWLAPIGLVVGGLVVATANGGLGTGNGLGGGVVAMILGLIGMVLGGLALARSRHQF